MWQYVRARLEHRQKGVARAAVDRVDNRGRLWRLLSRCARVLALELQIVDSPITVTVVEQCVVVVAILRQLLLSLLRAIASSRITG